MLSRVQEDNASLLGILRKLRTISAEEVTQFLDFIRSDTLLDVIAMTDWFTERIPEDDQVDSSGESGPSRPSASKKTMNSPFSLLDAPSVSEPGSSLEELRMETASVESEDTSRPHQFEQMQVDDSITFETVRHAIDSYSQSTGTLFYVFTKDQIDEIFDEIVDDFDDPENVTFSKVLKTEPSIELYARLAELCGMRVIYSMRIKPNYLHSLSQEWLL
jgi:hypothetical protein